MIGNGSENRSKKSRKAIFSALRINILIGLVVLAGVTAAQEPVPNIRLVDSITWAQYKNAEWDQLIHEGTKAIKGGLDYFYLRMRVGIAFYQSRNYRKAIPHFIRARELNPMDKNVLEYLYLSYLLGGRQQDAGHLLPEMDSSAKKRLGINERKFIEEIYFEGGPAFPGNQNMKGQRNSGNTDTIYNESYYYNSMQYGHAGIRIRLHPAISIYQGYSYMQVQFADKVSYDGKPIPDFNHTTKQNAYYGNLSILLPGGILATPAFQKLWLKYKNRIENYSPEDSGLIFDTIDENEQIYVASISLKKDVSIFAMEAVGTYGDFGHIKNKQLSLAGYVYPFGNLDLYAKTGITYLWNENDNRWIFHQMIGWSPLKKFWLEGSGTFGQLQDYAERNAFIIYNSPEEINYKIEGTMILEVTSNIELSLRYRFLERVNRYLSYTSFEDFTFKHTKYPYHTLIGGIKWRF